MNSTLEEDAAADNLTSFLDNDISNHIIFQINSSFSSQIPREQFISKKKIKVNKINKFEV